MLQSYIFSCTFKFSLMNIQSIPKIVMQCQLIGDDSSCKSKPKMWNDNFGYEVSFSGKSTTKFRQIRLYLRSNKSRLNGFFRSNQSLSACNTIPEIPRIYNTVDFPSNGSHTLPYKFITLIIIKICIIINYCTSDI